MSPMSPTSLPALLLSSAVSSFAAGSPAVSSSVSSFAAGSPAVSSSVSSFAASSPAVSSSVSSFAASSPVLLQPLSSVHLDSCRYTFSFPTVEMQFESLVYINKMEAYARVPADQSAFHTPSPAIDPSLTIENVISQDVQLAGHYSSQAEVDALVEMNRHSYQISDSISARLVSDTTTSADYAQYVNNYDIWWDNFQAMEKQSNIAHTSTPSRPITAAKVAHFLNHEISRPKRKRGSGDDIEGTTVGISVIKCTISALERQRRWEEHLYPDDPAAQKALRSDDRVKWIEDAMKHNQPQRVAQSQVVKAAGSSVDELSTLEFEDSEPTTGLTTGDLTNSPSCSVDPQQSPRVLAPEHPDETYVQAYGSQTAPSRVQSPTRVAVPSRTVTQGLSPSQLAGSSGTAHRRSPSPPSVTPITATQGHYSPRGIEHRSESHSDLGQVLEVEVFWQEYSEFITLKDNAEVVLAEAMEAMERLNTVFSRVRASMNRMSPRMKELLIVPVNQVSGRRLSPTSMIEPAPGSGAEERVRTTRSRVPGDQYSRAPLPRNIHEDIPHHDRNEQSEDSQPRHGCETHTVYVRDTPEARSPHDGDTTRLQLTLGVTRHSIAEPQSIDMNALREEIKATISATIKEKLHSDADSVTIVSQSMQALDSNAQYWSNLSNKAARCSRRALELQLKLAEEKVNNLLHEEAPEEALLEAAREARSIHFQLDQSSRLREAGLMPEQQVRFSANTGGNIVSPSRNYGPNPIIEPHIPHSEVNAQFGQQSTPTLSINAQLDGAVVDMTSEYSGIQQMVRQALQNASLEDEPEKSFLAKAGIKMGTPPSYSSERNPEKFENWVAGLLRF
ncbi:hypothetical protein M422DRAFT_256075, partial [Sphaerobolus stellatus SS14]